jgi:SAM-dependent methyltransferase
MNHVAEAALIKSQKCRGLFMNHKSDNLPKFNFGGVFNPDDYLYFYTHTLSDEITSLQIDFLTNQLALKSPMTILDLACGHGRHANRLAQLGYKVTGVDITPGFLKLAIGEARKLGVNVDYFKGDMRHLTYNNEFDRVILMFTAFGYFSDEENFQVLKNVARALKAGGLFCFDTHNRDNFLKGFLPFIVVEKGKDLLIDRNSFDTTTGRLINKRIIIRNGRRKDTPFFVRFYNYSEISGLLKKAGLPVKAVYGDWHGNPFNSDSRRMIIVARKE